MNDIDPIQLELMRNLFEAAADEMGITLQRVAFNQAHDTAVADDGIAVPVLLPRIPAGGSRRWIRARACCGPRGARGCGASPMT